MDNDDWSRVYIIECITQGLERTWCRQEGTKPEGDDSLKNAKCAEQSFNPKIFIYKKKNPGMYIMYRKKPALAYIVCHNKLLSRMMAE